MVFARCARRAAVDARRDPCGRAVQARAAAGLAAVGACRCPAASDVLNFCANNYLGLADHPDVVAAAARGALDEWGFGMASVRFICGTQTQHTRLEQRLSEFLGTEATILFSSCFDANGGLFEVLLDERDAVISDELNHASIIDGIRLCKAQRLRYQQPGHGRSRGAAAAPPRARAAADRHRRRVLDGRLPRAARRDLRAGRASTTRW